MKQNDDKYNSKKQLLDLKQNQHLFNSQHILEFNSSKYTKPANMENKTKTQSMSEAKN